MGKIERNNIMEMAIGRDKLSAAVPASISISRISSVAYAVDERASEAKMARPTALPIV